MSLGSKIIELRKERNISRQELADHLRLAYQTLAKYETDNRFPDKNTLIDLADFLDVSIDYLFERTEIKKIIGSNSELCINVSELGDEDIEFVKSLVDRLKKHEE